MNRRAALSLSWPVVAAIGGALFFAGGGALVAREQRLAQRARATLAQAEQEREWLARQQPAPTRENEAALTAEVDRLRAAAEALIRSWPAEAEEAASAEKPVDLYFDLAAFAESARTQAARAGVSVRPDERFGFASYARGGPSREDMAVVRRQRRDVQRLVETLLEAGPAAVVAVQRERPAGLAASPDDAATDYFAPAAARSTARRYRLEFTGQTPSLRNFLMALATRREPVLVRSVEVAPLAATRPASAPADDAAVPVVAENLSRFAVVVEWADAGAAPSS